jgi:hypothetical protein
MAGTFVEILNASGVPIDISIELVYDKRYRPEAVRQAAEEAVQSLLAFKNVDFGQPLYLSDIYGKVEAVTGVAAMTVTRFRRQDSPTQLLSDQLQQLAIIQIMSPSTPSGLDLAALLQRVAQIDVASDGRIDIKEFEIPVLGVLDIKLVEATR